MRQVLSPSMLARPTRIALAVIAALATVSAAADTVAAGFDYFQTVQPTTFSPLGGFNPMAGLPIGPGATDTIVQRLSDCTIDLNTAGSQCTIPIEMVALSLVSTVNPMVLIRESLALASAGQMTLISDGSGGGGTFDSFFDVFVDISLDGGTSWQPQSQDRLVSQNTPWYLRGLDFVVPFVSESSLLATHSAIQVPEPSTFGMIGLALAAMGLRGRAKHGARGRGQ